MSMINLMPRGAKTSVRAPTRFLFLSALLVILLILIYFGLYFLNQNTGPEIKAIEALTGKEAEKTGGARVSGDGLGIDQLNKIQQLLAEHLNWSKVFPEIERLTLSVVSFSGFTGTVGEEKTGLASINLTGKFSNFTELAKQVIAFRSSNIFETVDFSSQGLSKNGGIEAIISIKFSKWKLKS